VHRHRAERADGGELSDGDVDDPRRAVDQSETESQERIDRSGRDAGRYELRELLPQLQLSLPPQPTTGVAPFSSTLAPSYCRRETIEAFDLRLV
jgi:hypothetical protein